MNSDVENNLPDPALDINLSFDESNFNIENNRTKSTEEEVENERAAYIDQMIYDSISINLYPSVFIIQFISHMITPLAYFLINYQIQGFWSLKFFPFFLNTLSPIILYVTVTAFFMIGDTDRKPIDGMVWITLTMFIQHKLMVALKYASLSSTEYARFQNCKDSKQGELFLSQMQMLSGWSSRNESIIMFELGCAAARIGAKIDEIKFRIDNPLSSKTAAIQFAHWNAMFKGCQTVDMSNKDVVDEMELQEDGSYEVSVFDVSLVLVKRSEKYRYFIGWVECLFVYTLLIATEAYPLALLFSRIETFTFWLYIFLAGSCTLNIYYGTTGFFILLVGLWDNLRVLTILQELHSLIRLTDLTLNSNFRPRTKQTHNVKRIISKLTYRADTSIHETNFVDLNANRLRNTFASPHAINSLKSVNNSSFYAMSNKVEANVSKIMSAVPSKKRDHNEKGIKSSPKHYMQPKNASDSARNDNCTSIIDSVPDIWVDNPNRSVENFPNESEDQLILLVSKNNTDTKKRNLQRKKSMFVDFTDYSQDSEEDSKFNEAAHNARKKILRFLEYGNKLHQEDGEAAHIPKLSLRSRQNVMAWVYTRLLFQHFGDRFRLRSDTYTGGVALLMVAIMLYIIIDIILTPNPLQILESGFFYQSMLSVLTIWVILIALVTAGSMVNEELAVHSRTIWAHSLRLRDEVFINRSTFRAANAHHSPVEEEIEELQETIDLLESSAEVLDHYTQNKPLKILGIKVYSSGVATVVSTGISFLGLLFTLVTAELQEDK